jgi:hypothetical protein
VKKLTKKKQDENLREALVEYDFTLKELPTETAFALVAEDFMREFEEWYAGL